MTKNSNNMSFRSKAKFLYIIVITLLTVTTLMALYDGSYHIEGGAIAGIAFASIITSLLPFFISMHLLKKHELNSDKGSNLKIWALIIYTFCFPVKCWIIYSNLVLLICGGTGWSLG